MKNHSSVLALRTATEKIRTGVSILFFPEGTRSDNAQLHYPLKKDGFHRAVQTGVSIIPITVIGSRRVLPKHGTRVRTGRITLNIGKPIPSQGRDAASLMEEVYKSIKLGYTL